MNPAHASFALVALLTSQLTGIAHSKAITADAVSKQGKLEAVESATKTLQSLTDDKRIEFLINALQKPQLEEFAESQLLAFGDLALPMMRRAAIDQTGTPTLRAKALSMLAQKGDTQTLHQLKFNDPLLSRSLTAYQQVHAPELLEFQLGYLALATKGLNADKTRQELEKLEIAQPALKYAIKRTLAKDPSFSK